MKISLNDLQHEDLVFETPRDSLVLSCFAVRQKCENDDKTVWSDLNKLVVKAGESDYLSIYVEELKQIIIDNHVKNATIGGKGGISFEQKEKILDIVEMISNSTRQHQILAISNSFFGQEKKSKTSAIDSLKLTPESNVPKFFENISSLINAMQIKDKKKISTLLDDLNDITHKICELYATSHPLLTSEMSKVKNNIITLGKLYIDHDSPKNFAKCKESTELLEKLLKTLITTEDDSKVSKNDSIKLDDFPTVKYNTDQLKERVIRIEQQDVSKRADTEKLQEESCEYWKSQLFSSQTKYNTLKLYIDDMIFGLGFS